MTTTIKKISLLLNNPLFFWFYVVVTGKLGGYSFKTTTYEKIFFITR